MTPIGFNCVKVIEPLQGDSLLFHNHDWGMLNEMTMSLRYCDEVYCDQPAFTCSNSTLKKLEQNVKSVKVLVYLSC